MPVATSRGQMACVNRSTPFVRAHHSHASPCPASATYREARTLRHVSGVTCCARAEAGQEPILADGDDRSQSGRDASSSAPEHADLGLEELQAAPEAPAPTGWNGVAARYKIVAACSLAFVICNMDKVNMSVAIIPMAQEFGWSPGTAGLVQSSFFYGYMLVQLPGGYLASRFSGRLALPGGVAMWSSATAAVPLLAGTLPGLCFSRALVGLGEGVAPSAVNDMVAKVVPTSERSRSISFIFGGLHVGSIMGLLAAPPLIEMYGWPSVFYAFGALGAVWCAAFEWVVRAEGPLMKEARTAMLTDEAVTGVPTKVPWRAFVRNGPVRALMFTHLCNNWFHYTMLAWLPSYITDTLSMDLVQASQIALLPPLAGILVSSIAGTTADKLIESGWTIPHVRKLSQGTAFMLPAACLVAAAVTSGTFASVLFLAGALGLNSFSLGGLYCTHQDLSPKYAGALLGLTNTAGAIPGILGVATVGYLLDATNSWPLALFAPIITFFVLGALVFVTQSAHEEQDFSNDAPFAFESVFSGVLPKRD